MTAAEREISGLLDRAYHFTYGDGADPRVGNALATEAVGRGLLALMPLVKEIGDQLDTLPRKETDPPAVKLSETPNFDAAMVLVGAVAPGNRADEFLAARLLLDVAGGSPDPATLAVHALAAAHDSDKPQQVKAVKAAIDTLHIDIEDD